MAPRKTVQDIFGLKPEEVNALAVLSGLEGYRGGDNSPDVAAVAANVLSRRLSGQWGGNDIRNIAKAPGQYVAVDKYTMSQLADPAFGAKVLGSEAEFNRLRNIVNNPTLVGQQFKQSKGAQSFRGVSAYKNKKPEDYMPVSGKSNFYYNKLKEDLYNKGVGLFNQGAVSAPVIAATSPGTDQRPVTDIISSTLGLRSKPDFDDKKTLADNLKDSFKKSILEQLVSPFSGFQLPSFFGTSLPF